MYSNEVYPGNIKNVTWIFFFLHDIDSSLFTLDFFTKNIVTYRSCQIKTWQCLSYFPLQSRRTVQKYIILVHQLTSKKNFTPVIAFLFWNYNSKRCFTVKFRWSAMLGKKNKLYKLFEVTTKERFCHEWIWPWDEANYIAHDPLKPL